jgi:L-cysteine:1D-myo-inositol 2-amino-2-deoxy-alpha-D-glucopyranoside ligase
MRSWSSPEVPSLPGRGPVPRLFDTATGALAPSVPEGARRASLYVCGITPYDSTHLGHAATYVAFDTLVRAWRDAGLAVAYAQCVTEVDDPLLERAAATGHTWRDLATSQIDLYRADMEALRVIPPATYRGVEEQVPAIARAVAQLEAAGWAYRLPAPEGGDDLYADLSRDPGFGSLSHLDAEAMAASFAENGGDPGREGKRSPLDPLLWRAARAGEPSWESEVGRGRPGWHIECGVIARDYLGLPVDVQGGGRDLVFPHHEMSSSHLRGLAGEGEGAGGSAAPARLAVHAGMISLDGHKMSKSRGNLVFVSALRQAGVDPAAVRLALLDGHYREDRPWDDALLAGGVDRLARWRRTLRGARAIPTHARPGDTAQRTLQWMRTALADDLDTPAALAAVDAYCVHGETDTPSRSLVADAVDALLGVAL